MMASVEAPALRMCALCISGACDADARMTPVDTSNGRCRQRYLLGRRGASEAGRDPRRPPGNKECKGKALTAVASPPEGARGISGEINGFRYDAGDFTPYTVMLALVERNTVKRATAQSRASLRKASNAEWRGPSCRAALGRADRFPPPTGSHP